MAWIFPVFTTSLSFSGTEVHKKHAPTLERTHIPLTFVWMGKLEVCMVISRCVTSKYIVYSIITTIYDTAQDYYCILHV
jgi:hypothetical protein